MSGFPIREFCVHKVLLKVCFSSAEVYWHAARPSCLMAVRPCSQALVLVWVGTCGFMGGSHTANPVDSTESASIITRKTTEQAPMVFSGYSRALSTIAPIFVEGFE